MHPTVVHLLGQQLMCRLLGILVSPDILASLCCCTMYWILCKFPLQSTWAQLKDNHICRMFNIVCTIHTAQCFVNGSDIIVYKQRWTVSDTDDDRVSAHMHLYRPWMWCCNVFSCIRLSLLTLSTNKSTKSFVLCCSGSHWEVLSSLYMFICTKQEIWHM